MDLASHYLVNVLQYQPQTAPPFSNHSTRFQYSIKKCNDQDSIFHFSN
jgi:hypothetical protein